MDSLIALELRAELGKRLGLQSQIPSTIGFDTGTVGELTRALNQIFASRLESRTTTVSLTPQAVAEEPVYLTPEQVMDLSEEEVEQLLKERLSRQ
jgi:hypothetical protein